MPFVRSAACWRKVVRPDSDGRVWVAAVTGATAPLELGFSDRAVGIWELSPRRARTSMETRAWAAANTAFIVEMYWPGEASETDITRIRECRACGVIVDVAPVDVAASAPALEVKRAIFALFVYARASVRAPDMEVCGEVRSSGVDDWLSRFNDANTAVSIWANIVYLLAPEMERLVVGGASCISTSEPGGGEGDG